MTLKIDLDDFRVPEGKKVDLEKWPTSVKHAYESKKEYHEFLDDQVDELKSLQRLHYASNGYAVLITPQGMDAAGKDGVIRQVMSRVNPQGCQVFSFKQPSTEHLEHDFLWRTIPSPAGARTNRYLQPLLLPKLGCDRRARASGTSGQ